MSGVSYISKWAQALWWGRVVEQSKLRQGKELGNNQSWMVSIQCLNLLPGPFSECWNHSYASLPPLLPAQQKQNKTKVWKPALSLFLFVSLN